jgi:hypothetical protein
MTSTGIMKVTTPTNYKIAMMRTSGDSTGRVFGALSRQMEFELAAAIVSYGGIRKAAKKFGR